jgi:NDP-sugar pyrophosphorylase family protein
MVPVAILAGGMGTRLLPITTNIPKSLVEVAGEPFIAHQLRLLRRENVKRVVLCVGYLGEAIQAFVGTGEKFALEVAYSFDGEQLLGTGGALCRALPLLGDRFMVLYGDSYLDIAFAPVLDAFRRSGAPALMTVFRNSDRWDSSNVEFDGSKVVRYDKKIRTPNMHYIDYGLSVAKSEAFARQTFGDRFDLADLYGDLAKMGCLAGYEITERFYEVGSSAGLAEMDAFLRAWPKR